MKIRVSNIEDSFESRYKEDGASFYGSIEESSAGEILIDEPVSVDINIKKYQRKFHANGRVVGTMHLNCSRCLEKFTHPFDSTFKVVLMEEAEDDFTDLHEIELTHDDLRIEQFENGEIDVTKVVTEQIMLTCPMNPLCTDKCKGLCTLCGSNLNKGDCGCKPEEADNPFSILKNL